MEALLVRYQELSEMCAKTLAQTKAELLQKLHDTETSLTEQLAQFRAQLLALSPNLVLPPIEAQNNLTSPQERNSDQTTKNPLTESPTNAKPQKPKEDASEASEDDSTELFNLLASLHKSAQIPRSKPAEGASAKLTSSWTSHEKSDLARSNVKMGKKNESLRDESKTPTKKSVERSEEQSEEKSATSAAGEENSISTGSPRGNELADAKRVVCAVIYRGLTEIEGRQKKPTPKKYKGAFEGYAAVSFMMETMELKSREQAVQLGNACMGGYIHNVVDETLPFQDSDIQYYTFKFPVFMFPEKIAAKLKNAIRTLLRTPTKSVDEAVQFAHKGVANVIRTKAILMKSVLEIADRKGKRWNKRYALLYTHAIKLYKTEDAVEPMQLIILENIKNITYDEYKYDIMDFIRKKSNTTSMPFILTFIQGEKKYQMAIRASTPEEVSQWVLAIDGLKYQEKPLLSLENASCLDTSTKYLLLRMLYKDPYRGAMLKHGEDEWQYSDGIIARTVGESEIRYSWTGETLAPCVDATLNYGTGKWDGVNLYWFPPCAPGAGVPTKSGEFYFSPNPSYHYIYNATEKDYLCGNPEVDWKWSRHFLASKGSEKEWILEGIVPEPMVMLLQLMRYYINSQTAPPTLDKKALLNRTASSVNPAMSSLSHENKSIMADVKFVRRKSFDANDPVAPGKPLAKTTVEISASPTKESSSKRKKERSSSSATKRDTKAKKSK